MTTHKRSPLARIVQTRLTNLIKDRNKCKASNTKENTKRTKNSWYTTPEDYKYFKERCRYWQQQLGLTDWDIGFRHYNETDNECLATSSSDLAGMVALISLVRKHTKVAVTTEIASRRALDKIALHEMLHVLLTLLTWKLPRNDVYSSMEHSIINRLVTGLLAR